MYFDASGLPGNYLVNLWIAFGIAYSSDTTKPVIIRIYDGTSGTPSTELAKDTVHMGQIILDSKNDFLYRDKF